MGVADARERLRTARATLVVVDVELADGDGADLARGILADGLADAVLLLTTDRWDVAPGFDHGDAVDHVAKPFTLGDFLHRVDVLLRTAGPHVPAPRRHATRSDEGQVPQNVV